MIILFTLPPTEDLPTGGGPRLGFFLDLVFGDKPSGNVSVPSVFDLVPFFPIFLLTSALVCSRSDPCNFGGVLSSMEEVSEDSIFSKRKFGTSTAGLW